MSRFYIKDNKALKTGYKVLWTTSTSYQNELITIYYKEKEKSIILSDDSDTFRLIEIYNLNIPTEKISKVLNKNEVFLHKKELIKITNQERLNNDIGIFIKTIQEIIK